MKTPRWLCLIWFPLIYSSSLTTSEDISLNIEQIIQPYIDSDQERYPLDRLRTGDPIYTQYLQNKRYTPPQSSFTKNLVYQLSQADFMHTTPIASIEKWLRFQENTVWDAVRIIESPHFNRSHWSGLNKLPHFYLKRRMLVPFAAFLKRFEYENEVDTLLPSSRPFTALAFSFLAPQYLDDGSVDLFFRVLVESQSRAFGPCLGDT